MFIIKEIGKGSNESLCYYKSYAFWHLYNFLLFSFFFVRLKRNYIFYSLAFKVTHVFGEFLREKKFLNDKLLLFVRRNNFYEEVNFL